MCGIAGWIDWERDLRQVGEVIKNMTDILRHRGPDAEGMWLSPRAALGHRRLIVIDPEGGIQPMVCNEGGCDYVLTYNGEIYNFRELRRELEAKGHKFRSHSDTEVLLRSYLEWRTDCVRHLNGIFAFGLWDGQKEQLLLARDHLGVKPLFYAQRGSAVLFGSEVKALLAHPLVEPELDADGLAEAFNFYPFHTPGCGYFRDVFEVRPGQRIVFDRRGAHAAQYWSLTSEPHTDSLSKTAERIRALLHDTVSRQLVADVPVATLLSGGLDSSGLTGLAARDFAGEGKKLHTYSVDFEESSRYFVTSAIHESLDAPWVERVSQYIGTQHHNIIVHTPELLDNILVPMYAHDHPAYGQIETSMYLLFKAMKKEATVALSGESADEVFGGYSWYGREDLTELKTFPWIASFGEQTKVAEGILAWLSPELVEVIRPKELIARRYREAVAEVPRLDGEDALAAKQRESFYLNLTRFLPIMLDRKDRVSMAVGFEVRVPFCDYRLVQYVWNIPWKMKSVDDIEKGILRRAFADVLPEDVLYRRKSGYPTSQHPSYLRGVRDILLHILNDPNAPIRPYIYVPIIKDLLENNRSGAVHAFNANPVERIIQLNSWLKDYKIRVPSMDLQLV
jgi:asparagine synthase (glutamine-hydrolyzing)